MLVRTSAFLKRQNLKKSLLRRTNGLKIYPNKIFLVKLKVLKIRLRIRIRNLAPLNEPLNIYIKKLYFSHKSHQPRETIWCKNHENPSDEKSHTWAPLKGKVSRDGHFLEGLNILISTFCECADGFQCLSKAFHYSIQLLTFYLLL